MKLLTMILSGAVGCASLLSAAVALAGDAVASGPAPTLPPQRVALSSTSQVLAPTWLASSDPVQSNRALVRAEALRAGLPPDIADAVTEVESGYHPGTIGAAGEIGLMQVMPATARMLGFAGTEAELAAPAINIHYGVTYLAQAWRLADGDICTATMKYRAGHGETRFSHRSVDYCQRVRARLVARGYPVTGTVPVATFGELGWPGAGARGKRLRVVGRSIDLAGLNNKLRLVTEIASARARMVALR